MASEEALASHPVNHRHSSQPLAFARFLKAGGVTKKCGATHDDALLMSDLPAVLGTTTHVSGDETAVCRAHLLRRGLRRR